ncbi:hypothetical protein E5676_scaffold98G00670 [Cucumis melo var. makuwa]|uniref:Uncharacterized protein n=1 Tax=Cucumis melo var. makuwa TaxID=1194695 RepID=A0A5D3C0Z8_CUCMM|nr:hypothetical protein E6C27_scaffold262G001380 [Cucumis melo var. makuwa]TYK05611.1 hypothetical protein E5676_scaffold98G00670 [Cucumis melo var. makuwa]
MLAGLSEQVKSVATRNKVVEHQEIHTLAKGSLQTPKEGDANRIVKLIAWPRAAWTRMPTGRLQLLPHQLTTEANVWLFFIKKKIIAMCHDSTTPIEYGAASILHSGEATIQFGLYNEWGFPWLDEEP